MRIVPVRAITLLLLGYKYFDYVMGGISCGGDTSPQRINSDFNAYSSALRTYKIHAGRYPTDEEGLEALVTRPDSYPPGKQWTPIRERVQLDPWDHAYHYVRMPDDAEEGFKIICPGKDGRLGTEDDATSWDE